MLCSKEVAAGLVIVSRGLQDRALAVQHTLHNGLASAMHDLLDSLPTEGDSTLPTTAQVPVACAPVVCAPRHCPLVQPIIVPNQACGRC